MSIHFNILTLFPEMFPGFLSNSLAGKSLGRNEWSYKTINIRDYAEDIHKSVDDTPYGGGAGMVMRADILEKAFLGIKNPGRRIFLSPRGTPLKQSMVKDLAKMEDITLLCGRYEGVDERFIDYYQFEEISIGDYILSGGEPAALVLMDSCIRLRPGVMGNEDTMQEESFENSLLEYPHYTRPDIWNTVDNKQIQVPEILKSGDHAKIKKWREKKSLEITNSRRPDLLKSDG
jgi:tRNA (guanine37-N1)-methyltransferase